MIFREVLGVLGAFQGIPRGFHDCFGDDFDGSFKMFETWFQRVSVTVQGF